MRVQFVSDLHAEGMDLVTPGEIHTDMYNAIIACESDVLILDGDISGHHSLFYHLNKFSSDLSDKHIIFVPGNHEYYYRTRSYLDEQLGFASHSYNKLHILVDQSVVIDGVLFIGSTGWWDGSGGRIDDICMKGINDFRCIYDIMDANCGISWGRKAKTFIRNELHRNARKLPTVCITHSAPSLKSIHSDYYGHPSNGCFVNDWEDLIEEYSPNVWVHGHTHSKWDYMIGDTRILCNPLGIVRYEEDKMFIEVSVERFNPQLCFDIEV